MECLRQQLISLYHIIIFLLKSEHSHNIPFFNSDLLSRLTEEVEVQCHVASQNGLNPKLNIL